MQQSPQVDPEALEVLAFNMWLLSHPDPADEPPVGDLPTEDYLQDKLSAWRTQTDIRQRYRAIARQLLQRLAAAGLAFKSPVASKLDAALVDILTIPAQQAYVLPAS